MPYVTTSYLGWLRPRLTPRDLAIIEDVGRFKLMSSSQIRRIFFAERADTGHAASELSRARKCRAVLSRLTKHGILARLEERDATKSSIYSLDIAGLQIAGLVSDRPRRKYAWHSPLIPHTLAVPELWARIVEASRAGQLTLPYDLAPGSKPLESEPTCWRQVAGQTLKPDAFVILDEIDGGKRYRSNFYIEIDRGSQWGTQVTSKFPIYNLFWEHLEGQGRKSRGCLILVTNENRKRYLSARVQEQPERDRAMYRVALFDDALDVLKE